jgi:trk system potassium uptake protein
MSRNLPPQENPEPDSTDYLARIPLGLRADPPPYTPPTDWTPAQPQNKRSKHRLQTPQILILGFALLILLGTLLLKLPAASANAQNPIGWMDAFFTATSAITVTGLAVRTTAIDFSRFGQVIILILLQVGGVGFIAFSVLLLRLIGRRVTLNERFIIQQSLGAEQATGVGRLALYVLAVTLSVEAVGAFLLWLRWRATVPDAIWQAIFHAISSYCNAGFDLFSGTDRGVLFGYGSDFSTLAVLGTLILLGGFGITVLYDLASFRVDRMLALNTRITLLMTLILTVTGTFLMMLDSAIYTDILTNLPFHEKLWVSLFTIVSARTAGLTILPLEQLSEATQAIIMIWMFIGGAPASMAGGVTSSVVGVLLISVIATAKGHNAAVAFGRTVPTETIFKAVAIMTVSTLLVAVVTLALSLMGEGSIFAEGFEVISAFANAGYSLNFTSSLDNWGRFLIAFTMFWGRLGPLTIVVALAQSEQPSLIRRPEEPVILG